MTTVLIDEKDHFRNFLRSVLNDPTMDAEITYTKNGSNVTDTATLEESKIPARYGKKQDMEKAHHWEGNSPDFSFYCPSKNRWLTVMWNSVVSVTYNPV